MVRGLTLIYGFKRFFRSWKLFAALLLGVVLASTFFAGINIGADTAAKQTLDEQLSHVAVDIIVRSNGGVFRPTITLKENVIGTSAEIRSSLSSSNATEVANLTRQVDGVDEAEVISRVEETITLPASNNSIYFTIAGISDDSRIHDGLTIVDGSSSLQENQTYVWIDSQNAKDIKINDVLTFNFSIWIWEDSLKQTEKTITLNLTVTGFVDLDNKALAAATGQYYYYGQFFGGPSGPVVIPKGLIYGGDLLIVSWQKTFAKLMDHIYTLSPTYNPLDTDILVYVDREKLINAWDVGGSINRLNAITLQLNNKVSAPPYYMSATNNLQNLLNMYQAMAIAMRFIFLITGLPVFFVAWYMGMTVSDVSFNLRRREIGLLSTKGFSRGQLLGMFLAEAFLIGLIAGIVGIALSFLLNPFFVQAVGGQFSGALVIGPDTIAITIIFSVIITFLSTFMPARRASQLKAVDALREYVYTKEAKPYKKTWPLIALSLGSYKIVILLLGINLTAEMSRLMSRNIILMILLGIATFLDGILTYIGPLLFFWGFTKIFIRGSLKFQQLTAKAARFLGDLGALATRNVQRNPARAASVAFLIALIIGYSFQVIGGLASEQDYTIRNIYESVGADIGVSLSSTINASAIMNNITKLPDVSSVALESSFDGQWSDQYMRLTGVNPEDWLATAYYENEWFAGSSVETAFQSLASDNDTIILERSIAMTLNMDVGGNITVTVGQSVRTLKVVGFFGVEPPESGPFVQTQYGYSFLISHPSYIPEGLYNQLSTDISYASAKILVKLQSGVNGTVVADQIRELDPNINWVSSVEEQLQQSQSNPMLSGIVNVQRLGIAFAILAASLGTALVALVSLKERSREASLMSVRGLSYKQLIIMLLTENLAIVTFAVLLGAIVGLIIVHGNVAAANAYTYTLVSRRVVFPIDSTLMLLSCFALVFVSTILPVIVVVRRYVTRLERMVRLG